MSYIAKPRISHPSIRKNKLGLTSRDYEGAVSTLCAGCGHDSVTAAIIQVVFDLDIEPHMLAKMSGIGCSSKTPAYFVQQSHGFNSVHGRMPSVTTGANTANRHLTYIGVSGDGDSLSIGVGQFVHAIRRNVNMCYIIENNGVYGLTRRDLYRAQLLRRQGSARAAHKGGTAAQGFFTGRYHQPVCDF
jgi:2-oxoglutarate ferredoxin oxidoreductase subunit beta